MLFHSGKCMHQKCNSRHDHATRFFDGITSFFSMLHSFLTAFRKTLHTTINQLITKNIENLFFKDKRELEKSLLKEKNKIIMNQKLQEKCKRKQCGNVSQKICNPLVKAKNDFHSFIAAIHPLTLLSLFDYFLSRSDRGWTYLSEMNINKRKYADR